MGDMRLKYAESRKALDIESESLGDMTFSQGTHALANVCVSWERSNRRWSVAINANNRRDRWEMPTNIDRAYYLEMGVFLESCACHYTLAGNTLPQAERTLRTLLEAKAWRAQ
jgi:hypothetical protein